MICFRADRICNARCGPDDGCASAPKSCDSRHPTEKDFAYKIVDKKVVIERHPLKCWHGEGHEGKHGYGATSWE